MKTSVAVLGVLVLVAAGCAPNLYDVKTDRALFLDARPGQKVCLMVTDTSLMHVQPVLAQQIAQDLKGKGYVLVDSPDAADFVLRANVTYSGLMEEAIGGEATAGGAAAGAVIGAGTAYATGSHGRGTVGGAIIGGLAGAGLGYWMESANKRNTYLTTVNLQVEDRLKKQTQEATINARIRKKDLTAQTAVTMLLPDISTMIAGHFSVPVH